MPRAITFQCPNLKLYDDGSFLLSDLRASYPHLAEPWANPKDPKASPKHSLVGLMDKATHAKAQRKLMEMINALIVSALKVKAIASKDKAVRDGDEGAKEEAQGCWTINTSSSADRPPSVRGQDTRPIEPRSKIKGVILPGYRVNILGSFWAQDNEWGKKINCELIAVQFVRKDEVIGQDRISEDDIDDAFDAVEDDDEGSGFDDGQDGEEDDDPL